MSPIPMGDTAPQPSAPAAWLGWQGVETSCMGDPPHSPISLWGAWEEGSPHAGHSEGPRAAEIPRIFEPAPPSLLSLSPAPRAFFSTWALALCGGSSPQGGGPAVTPTCSPNPGSGKSHASIHLGNACGSPSSPGGHWLLPSLLSVLSELIPSDLPAPNGVGNKPACPQKRPGTLITAPPARAWG